MRRTTANADWLDQATDEIDLRRRHRESLTDHIVHRADWLEPADCELVLSIFRDGRTACSIAKLTNQPPRIIRKRIKRLVTRLNDPCVAYVIAHLDQWSKSRREIAHALFIQGYSMRETTDELGVSLYSVRKHRQEIEAMCQATLSSKSESTSTSNLRAWR